MGERIDGRAPRRTLAVLWLQAIGSVWAVGGAIAVSVLAMSSASGTSLPQALLGAREPWSTLSAQDLSGHFSLVVGLLVTTAFTGALDQHGSLIADLLRRPMLVTSALLGVALAFVCVVELLQHQQPTHQLILDGLLSVLAVAVLALSDVIDKTLLSGWIATAQEQARADRIASWRALDDPVVSPSGAWATLTRAICAVATGCTAIALGVVALAALISPPQEPSSATVAGRLLAVGLTWVSAAVVLTGCTVAAVRRATTSRPLRAHLASYVSLVFFGGILVALMLDAGPAAAAYFAALGLVPWMITHDLVLSRSWRSVPLLGAFRAAVAAMVVVRRRKLVRRAERSSRDATRLANGLGISPKPNANDHRVPGTRAARRTAAGAG